MRARVCAKGKADFIFQRPVTVGNMKGATPKKRERQQRRSRQVASVGDEQQEHEVKEGEQEG